MSRHRILRRAFSIGAAAAVITMAAGTSFGEDLSGAFPSTYKPLPWVTTWIHDATPAYVEP